MNLNVNQPSLYRQTSRCRLILNMPQLVETLNEFLSYSANNVFVQDLASH